MMNEQRRHRLPRWARTGLALCFSAWMLLACGGGGDSQAGVGSGGTGSYSGGPITALGSIVVNGIHFDPSLAAITDEEGTAILPADLQVGMVVALDASSVTTVAGRRVADVLTVKVISGLLGPVDAVGTSTLTVMGQTVRVRSDTRFGDGLPSGLTSVSPGDVVEVHGFDDASGGVFVATRIALKDPAQVSHYVVRGVLKDLDLNNQRCRIGNQLLSYDWGSGTTPPVGLADGRVARAELYKVPGTLGASTLWTANVMALSEPLVSDRDDAYVDGLLTDVASGQPGHFSVDGIAVDATQAQCAPACSSLRVGDHVQVRGRLVQGVVTAATVTAVF